MENQRAYEKMVDILNEWDPFQLGSGNYDPEIADCLQAARDATSVGELAKTIQQVFSFSFEQAPPLGSCLTVATELRNIVDKGC
ncbi:DUF1871 family protein [Bacillus fonticola]|uniref:DUF1871 family protein n=1 Tax=Bacillus fonticola TaxID=2728853 RepID=UPI001473EA12|nr:DUF1871 family protein [Bacillus fonticola]